MPHPEAPELPTPALFDVTTTVAADPAGTLVRIPLDEIELAPTRAARSPRRALSGSRAYT